MRIQNPSELTSGQSRPHVLHVIQSTSGGGAEYVARQVANHQKEHFKVSLLTWEPETSFAIPGGVNHIKVEKKSRGLIGLFRLAFDFRTSLQKQNVDVVVAHMHYSAVLAWLSLLNSGVKLRIFVHHSSSSDSAMNIPSWMLRCIYKNFKVVAVSEDSAKSLKDFVDRASIKILPNPLELSSEPKKSVQLKYGNPVRLVAVGRLAPVKNYSFMFEALRFLKADFQLTIIGDGETTLLRTEAVRLGLERKIVFLGWLDPRDIDSYLRSSDIFLMTSNYEGEPSALLEAAAVGLSVVARRTPGLGSAVAKVGGYSPTEDTPQSFADALQNVLNSPIIIDLDRSWMEAHAPEKASHEYCQLIINSFS